MLNIVQNSEDKGETWAFFTPLCITYPTIFQQERVMIFKSQCLLPYLARVWRSGRRRKGQRWRVREFPGRERRDQRERNPTEGSTILLGKYAPTMPEDKSNNDWCQHLHNYRLAELKHYSHTFNIHTTTHTTTNRLNHTHPACVTAHKTHKLTYTPSH